MFIDTECICQEMLLILGDDGFVLLSVALSRLPELNMNYASGEHFERKRILFCSRSQIREAEF